jgi:hypothetical protein
LSALPLPNLFTYFLMTCFQLTTIGLHFRAFDLSLSFKRDLFFFSLSFYFFSFFLLFLFLFTFSLSFTLFSFSFTCKRNETKKMSLLHKHTRVPCRRKKCQVPSICFEFCLTFNLSFLSLFRFHYLKCLRLFDCCVIFA